MLLGLSENVEYFQELVYVVSARKQRTSNIEFDDDTGQGENVNSSRVFFGGKQVLGGTVPPSRHVVSVNSFAANGESEVNKQDLSFRLIDDYVFRLDIPVDDASLVYVSEAKSSLE